MPKLDKIDYISCMDCIEGMKYLPDGCIDLIIADPPYNLSKSDTDLKLDDESTLVGMGGNWKITNETWDSMTLSDYTEFTKLWLSEAKRILSNTGSMWIFGTYHNIGIVNVICQQIGLEILNEVIWYKKNAFPNLTGRRLTASHENILWVHPEGKGNSYYFDYDYSKTGDFSDDTLKSPGKQMRTVWDMSNNKSPEELKYGKHPTQKPIKVLDRIINLSSRPDDVMLTPFSGAGSECVAAKLNHRHYIGFELDQDYCKIAEDRLRNTVPKVQQFKLF